MALEIYDGATFLYALPRVMSASLTDKLSGEQTLSFSTLISRSQGMRPGLVAKLDGQDYSVVRVSRKIADGFPITMADCEHISYLLNDEAYNLVTFVFEGSPLEGLQRLLGDTPFSIGICEATETVAVAFTEGTLNRRNALMRFVDACGCEVEYDGYAINLRKHRGSTARKVLMDGENVTGLSVTLDSREDTAAYEISLFKMSDLQAGDEVNITYTPMGINVDTRIVSITYNPFYRYSVRVEVGDYVPNLLASTSTQLDRIRQGFRAADGRLESTISDVDGNLSQLTQTVSGFDLRIQNAEGSVSSLALTVNGFQTRIENAEGNISAISQTANKINWLVASGTSSSNFTMTDRAVKLVADKIDLSGYVTFSALGTAGKTAINGANITTGTISAERIDTSTLRARTIYALSGKISLMEQSSSTMLIGGDGTWNYDDINLFAGKQVKISRWDSARGLVFDTNNFCIRSSEQFGWSLGSISYPFSDIWCENIQLRSGSSTVARFGFNSGTFECVFSGAAVNRLGSSTYYWDTGYISKLYLGSSCYLSTNGTALCVNGTAISGGSTSGSDFAGKEVKMGGSTSYYIVCNTSRELRPSSSSTTYPGYLGTSTYYWHYAYLGSNTVKLGSSASSKLGFFAAAPIARQALSTTTQNMGYSSATATNYLYILNNLVGILKNKYGLIG